MTEEENNNNNNIETVEENETMDDTNINIEDTTIQVIETPIYTFTITQQLDPNYGVTTKIIQWLQTNMTSLKDDYENSLFGKVNYGFNEKVIKTFGKKPVCDVYINKIEYDTDFDAHTPKEVHSIVIFYMKGANNKTYLKATELHDLLMQKFLTDENFIRSSEVRETYITDSTIQNRNIRGGYGVMGTFELTHILW